MQECRLRKPNTDTENKGVFALKTDYFIATIFALWIGGTFLARLLSEMYFQNNGILKIIITSVSLLWPFGFFILTKYKSTPKYNISGDKIALFLFLMFSLISCIISPIMMQSASYFLITALTIFIILQFKTNMSPADLGASLQIYSILTIITLLLFAKYDYAPGFRLGQRTDVLNPNSLGLIAMSVVITASSIKYQVVRYMIIASAVLIIYLTGSRAAMLAALIGYIVVNKYRFDALKFIYKVLAIIALTIVVVFIVGYYFDDIVNAIESFFKFTDKHRGLASGGSGRTIIWGWMWDVFVQHPVFGVGFRAHGEFIAASSAHNGYLATLVDIGVVGFLSIMYLVFVGVLRMWRNISDKNYLVVNTTIFSLVIAYLSLAMFERYLINIGNPASLLFIFAILGFYGKQNLSTK